MNHLAHVVLAGPDTGPRLGAFLGDHVKGRAALESLPADWALGVIVHRRVDTLSDLPPAVLELLAELPSPWRRYGGIMLDVLFDHMLTRHWDRFGPAPLSQLAGEIDELLARYQADLPLRLRRFSQWAANKRLWQRYGERAMLEEIFSLLAWRHGRRWPLEAGARLLDSHEAVIERAFLSMFPDLQAQIGAERERLYSTWSIM